MVSLSDASFLHRLGGVVDTSAQDAVSAVLPVLLVGSVCLAPAAFLVPQPQKTASHPDPWTHVVALPPAGYDNYGYDKYGYDRTGYNKYGEWGA
jgi:hypothetical protein